MRSRIRVPLHIYKFSGDDYELITFPLSESSVEKIVDRIIVYGNHLESYITPEDTWGKGIQSFVVAPKVDFINGKYYGLIEIDTPELISKDDSEEIMHFLMWELSDGWGEGFSQENIFCEGMDHGRTYLNIHYWNSEEWDPVWQ